jgi:hypothetical protein
MHEMLHAAGMYHEQSRADRDNSITIQTANISAGYEHNFNKVANSISSCAYDFGSIMHYPLTAFSANGKPTIQLKVPAPAGVTIGQRSAMSACDKSGVNSLYPSANGCGTTCAPFKVYGVIGSRYTQLGGSTGFLMEKVVSTIFKVVRFIGIRRILPLARSSFTVTSRQNGQNWVGK